MSIKKRSDAMKFLEKLSGGPLSFAELIESIRLGEEMSQVEFAKKLGISRSHLCDIEKGRKMVSPTRATRFAKILGYSSKSFIELALQDQIKGTGLQLKVVVKAA